MATALAFDFDIPIDRTASWSEKWDLRESLYGRADVMPLWVADMDFAAPPFVIDAIQQRLQHPVLGYTHPPLSVAQSVCTWQQLQHDWTVLPAQISWLAGVVSGLNIAVQAFTQPQDGVVVFTPVYAPFMRTVKQLDRDLRAVPLLLDETVMRYDIDWQVLENQLSKPDTKLLLLSNPHNPSGRVWTRDELQRLAQRCLTNGVLMVSDEVWSDLLLDEQAVHVPLARLGAAVADQTITLSAPSKTFNLASLHTAYAIISNPSLQRQFIHQQQVQRAGEASLFGLHALQAAYTDAGRDWLAQLLAYLRGNLAAMQTQLTAASTHLRWISPQASYLLWLDCRGYVNDQKTLEQHMVTQAGLGLSSGTQFGVEGTGFMRLNFALPRGQLMQAMQQLEQAFSVLG